ncbi:hypothetical protein BESB_000150 [Besnoitia besnoiti]|uniref:Myb family DNA-binding domain-containing protein n=1 Tax=Besnoitia besnoiti TaxID=94643 RepID=A0A2A9MNW5_BESBE|nr:hypothetical protein BESB_000150 [Besnoitia besnoiti]PFH37673.1 hypothetical protein BESB_000150 [Besnoitia besnoiti]
MNVSVSVPSHYSYRRQPSALIDCPREPRDSRPATIQRQKRPSSVKSLLSHLPRANSLVPQGPENEETHGQFTFPPAPSAAFASAMASPPPRSPVSSLNPCVSLLNGLQESEAHAVERFAVLCCLERRIEAEAARLARLLDRMRAQRIRLQFQQQQPRQFRGSERGGGKRRWRGRVDECGGSESEEDEGKSMSLLLNEAGQPLPSNPDAIHIWTLRNRLQHLSRGSSRAKLSAAASKAGALVCPSAATAPGKARGEKGSEAEKKIPQSAVWERGDPGWSSAILRWQLERLKVKRRRRVKKEEDGGAGEKGGSGEPEDRDEEAEEREEEEAAVRERMAAADLRVFRSFVRELCKTLVSIPISTHAVRALFDYCRVHSSSPHALPASSEEAWLPLTPGEVHPSKLLYATRSLLLASRRLCMGSAAAAGVHVPAPIPTLAEVLRVVCTAVSASLPPSVSWAFTPAECLTKFINSVQARDDPVSGFLFASGGHDARGAESSLAVAPSHTSGVVGSGGPQVTGENRGPRPAATPSSSSSHAPLACPHEDAAARAGALSGQDFRLLASVEEAIVRGLGQVAEASQRTGAAEKEGRGEATDEETGALRRGRQAAHTKPGKSKRGERPLARMRQEADANEAEGDPHAGLLSLRARSSAAGVGADAGYGDGQSGAFYSGATLSAGIRAALSRCDQVPILFFSSLVAQPVTPFSVFQVYLHLKKRSSEQHDLVAHRRWWAAEEDAALLRAVESVGVQQRGAGKWMKVAAMLPGRTNNQCRARYLYLSVEGKRHGLFSALEDIRLQILVSCYGRGTWGKIARHLRGRTEMKCRERYENCLHEEVKSLPWTVSEVSLLQVAASFYHQDWRKVARVVTGRPAESCREKFEELEVHAELERACVRLLRLSGPETEDAGDAAAEERSKLRLHSTEGGGREGVGWPPHGESGSLETASHSDLSVVAWAQSHVASLLRLFLTSCPQLFPASVHAAVMSQRSSASPSWRPFPALSSEDAVPNGGRLLNPTSDVWRASDLAETQAPAGAQERADQEGEGACSHAGGARSAGARGEAIQFARYLDGVYAMLGFPDSPSSTPLRLDGSRHCVSSVGRSLSESPGGVAGGLGSKEGDGRAGINPQGVVSSAPFSFSASEASPSLSALFSPLASLVEASPGSFAAPGGGAPHVPPHPLAPPSPSLLCLPPAPCPPSSSSEPPAPPVSALPAGVEAPEGKGDESPGAETDDAIPPSVPPEVVKRARDTVRACLFLLLRLEKSIGFDATEHAPRLIGLLKGAAGRRSGETSAAKSLARRFEGPLTGTTGICGSSPLAGQHSRPKGARRTRGRETDKQTHTQFPLVSLPEFLEGGLPSEPCLPDPRLPATALLPVVEGLLRWLAAKPSPWPAGGSQRSSPHRVPRDRASLDGCASRAVRDPLATKEGGDELSGPLGPSSGGGGDAGGLWESAGCAVPRMSASRAEAGFDRLDPFAPHPEGPRRQSAVLTSKRLALRRLQRRPLPAALVEAATKAAAAEMKRRGLDQEARVSSGVQRGKDVRQRTESFPSVSSPASAEDGSQPDNVAPSSMPQAWLSCRDEQGSVEGEQREGPGFGDVRGGGLARQGGSPRDSTTRRNPAHEDRQEDLLCADDHLMPRWRDGEVASILPEPVRQQAEGSPSGACGLETHSTADLARERSAVACERKRGGRGRRNALPRRQRRASGCSERRTGRQVRASEEAGESLRDSPMARLDTRDSSTDGPRVRAEREEDLSTGNTSDAEPMAERQAKETARSTRRSAQRQTQKGQGSESEKGDPSDPGAGRGRQVLYEGDIAEGLAIGCHGGDVDVRQMCERVVVGLPLIDGKTGKAFTEGEAHRLAWDVAERLRTLEQGDMP